MFSRNFLVGLLTIAIFMIGGVAIFAQSTQPIRGRVEVKSEDGTSKPVEGAMVEMYRVDIKSKLPSTKTDKKGVFTFAGAPLGADLALAVSAPGYSAEVIPNIRAGREDLVIVLRPGDGKQLTEAQVREMLAAGTTSGNQKTREETPEEKKKREEYEKQVAEVNARNEKAKKANEVVEAAMRDGGAAYDAKNYDLAIAKFREGYEIDPEFEGSATVMLNNKALALMARARESYNKAVRANSGMAEARAVVKSDLSELIDDTVKVLKLLEGKTGADSQQQAGFEKQRLMALINRKEAFRLLAETSSDLTRGKDSIPAFQEYMVAEPDPVKKAKAQVQLADTLRESMEYDLAVVEYRKVLETEANNPDAMAGLGLCMVAVGYMTMEGDPERNLPANAAKGKQELQEAANMLQRFVDIAPPDHRLLASVRDSIVELKNLNVAPQKGKTPTNTKKKN